MIHFKTGTTITIEAEDGSLHEVTITSVKPSELGTIQLTGQFIHQESINLLNEPLEHKKGRIQSSMHCSALVRFLHKGRMRTAAVTHTTQKAFRIINTDLGVAWIPIHILRWSEQAKQFVMIDEEYEVDFTFDVKPGMDDYPYNMEPENLIMLNELTNSAKSKEL